MPDNLLVTRDVVINRRTQFICFNGGHFLTLKNYRMI